MDPAHNLSDIFDKTFSEKPGTINENLTIIEINLQKWIKQYLSGVERQMQNNYRYLSALNLEKHFQTIRYAPGIEEYALLLAFSDIRTRYADLDYLVFDMPPTALSLKFFNLPRLSLIWLEKLSSIRGEILKKKQMVHKIKFGKRIVNTDKISNNLTRQSEHFKKLSIQFESREETILNLILNNDKLSVNESRLIIDRLLSINIQPSRLIVNKLQDIVNLAFVKKELPAYSVYPLIYADFPLTDLNGLNKYLDSVETSRYLSGIIENF